ncbi:M23 family metallopeptidase [Hyphococcus sp.]|uniref:M23 family metallopeptidase n=1 Tax=Hyphococcus sp. TaxID=2038636 RepID=UPI0035C66BBF
MKSLFALFAMTMAALPAAAQEESKGLPEKPSTKIFNVEEDDGKDDLARRANFAEAMNDVAERQKVFAGEPEHFSLEGSFAQGGILFGQTEIGASVKLDGEDVMVDDDGRFLIGFGRDSALTSLVVVTLPDGTVERRSVEIEDRDFPVQRIDGLDQSKVSGFTEEQLAKIAADSALKKAARTDTQRLADWSLGFDWPVTGRISGVFGSQRILNGEPKRPHSGLDIAAPTGTPIRAPAPGIVRLAEDDMYFEGGLVLLDHGHWLESAFLHMSRIDVEPGQRVEKGDIIGAVGATGRVTGPHLHWSMKWAGRLVDPQLTLDPMTPVTASSGGQ